MRQNEGILSAFALLISIAWAGCAATISKTGTSPEDSVLIDFTLVGGGTVTLQTSGFGRGDPLLSRPERERLATCIHPAFCSPLGTPSTKPSIEYPDGTMMKTASRRPTDL
jgi:hypothetical protein